MKKVGIVVFFVILVLAFAGIGVDGYLISNHYPVSDVYWGVVGEVGLLVASVFCLGATLLFDSVLPVLFILLVLAGAGGVGYLVYEHYPPNYVALGELGEGALVAALLGASCAARVGRRSAGRKALGRGEGPQVVGPLRADAGKEEVFLPKNETAVGQKPVPEGLVEKSTARTEENVLIERLGNDVDLNRPVLLHENGLGKIYWVGSEEHTAFRCNAYLVMRGGHNYLIDPGGRFNFPQVVTRVEKVMDPTAVTHLVVHHQDPDLCASIPLWAQYNPGLSVLTTSRTAVLLPHYGFRGKFTHVDSGEVPGCDLVFVPAPFLHFPGAFITYDPESRFLFSGDIFAAISDEWSLFVEDLEAHFLLMEVFHVDYMACNKAIRGFLNSLEEKVGTIRALLPQHGSIIRQPDVRRAFEWLWNLQCGLDFLYPESGAETLAEADVGTQRRR